MGIFSRIKEFRERRGRALAEARQHHQFIKEVQEEARIERETQKLEKELPLLQHRAEAVKLREQIRVARERALAGPHADIRSMHAPMRRVSDVHSGFFGGGKRQQQTRTQPPTSLTGFEFGFGIKQPGPQQEKKKRVGAFGEPL